ncbi:MAG: hypothetical protein ABIY55_31930 [Kofleriaceae bacterium]
MTATRDLLARRIGRITFGGVLLIGVAYLVFAASAGTVRRPWYDVRPPLDAAKIISATWLAALLAGIVARQIARRLPMRWNPDALFAESVIVPVFAMALLLPLTLHMPIALLAFDSESFDTWVGLSMWITGLAHLVFAITSAMRGYQLVMGRPAYSPRRIVVVTLITSCVPFIVLLGVPPLLVVVTALALVPLLRAMEPIVTRERGEVVAAPHALPRAIAVVPRPTA